MQRYYQAINKAGPKTKTTEIKASHVVMLSHPTEVLRIIEEAASSKK